MPSFTVCATFLVCSISVVCAEFGTCPDDFELTEEMRAQQLELEEYFVGHSKLPFFQPIDDFIENTAGSLGLQSNQFRYISGMLLMYPLAILFHILPNVPALKYFFALSCGVFASLYCFGVNTLVPLSTTLLIFVLMKVTFGGDTDEKYVKSKLVPVAYFSLMLAILSGVHIHRMYIDYGGFTLDVSGPQMVVTIKLCQVVWNVFDFRNKNDKFKNRSKNAVDIRELSLIPFLTYVFFFPGYLAGPAFELRHFLDFMNGKGGNGVKMRPLLAAKIALKKLGISLIMMAITVLLSNRFPPQFMLCDTWRDWPLLQRIGYLWLSVSLLRPKYYVAWYLAEGSLVLSGLAWNDASKEFDKMDNSRLYHIECGGSIREAVNNWNMKTSLWLRHYVYERVIEVKYGALIATGMAFMTSAFWHGFYAGYYLLFFFIGVFVQPLGKELRRNLRPYFEDHETGKTPTWYNVGGILMTSTVLNFFAMPFGLLSFASSIEVWSNVYYYGIIGVFCVMPVPLILKKLTSHHTKIKAYKEIIKQRRNAKST
jgi:lysophospholipid acyltransferase